MLERREHVQNAEVRHDRIVSLLGVGSRAAPLIAV